MLENAIPTAVKPMQGWQGRPFRDGSELVVPKGTSLPLYCVKCGKAGTTTVDMTFRWMNPLYYLLILLGIGILLLVIIRMIFGKKIKLSIPLCDVHRRYIHRLRIASVILLLGSIPVAIICVYVIGGPEGAGWGMLVWVLTALAGLITLHLQRPLHVKSIGDDRAIMKGTSEAFLSQLSAANVMAAASGSQQ